MKSFFQSPAGLPSAQAAGINPWRELSLLTLMLMELSWITPWYFFVGAAQVNTPALHVYLVFGGVLLASYLAMQALAWRKASSSRKRQVFAILLVLSMLVGLKVLAYGDQALGVGGVLARTLQAFNQAEMIVPVELVVMIAILLLSYRGAQWVRAGIGPSAVMGSFRTGAVALLLLAVLSSQAAPAGLDSRQGYLLHLSFFLGSGLMAMSAARISILSQLRGGQRIPFDRRRLAGVVLPVVGLVGLSVLVALAASQQGFLNLALSALLHGLRLFLTALVVILTPLLRLIFNIFAHLLSGLRQEPEQEQALDIEQRLEAMREALEAPLPELDIGFRVLPFILWGIVLLVMALVVLRLRTRSRRERAGWQAENESLFETADLLRQLGIAAQRKLQDLAAGLAGLSQARRARAAARVRQIYAELLVLSASLGHPRQPSETPFEFLPELRGLFPTLPAELSAITQAYQRVRYGEFPESLQEVEVVEIAWKRVYQAGQGRLAARRQR